MKEKQIFGGTIVLPNRPGIVASAAVVGKKEGEGPLGDAFDRVVADDLFGEESWEKAECRFHYTAAELCLQKAAVLPEQVDVTLGGDLLNQIMAASTAAQKLATPFLGIYGACSTMTETLCLAAMLVDGGYMRRALCCASSHFCSAERQYRFPLEYGNQRPPTAQWTVTGAGALLLDGQAHHPICRATHVTIGRIVDLSIKDATNMGAAMAPAAADTLRRHLLDTGRTSRDYDLILSGDLGKIGHDLLLRLMEESGMPLDTERYADCGMMIFSPAQDVHAGGSGCGCSAAVFCSRVMRLLAEKKLRRVLFMATGALLSPTFNQQGGAIPGIAHAVTLEVDE